MHPAPKRRNAPAVDEEVEEEGNAGTDSAFTVPQRALNAAQRKLEKTHKTQAEQRSPFCWDGLVSSDATGLEPGPGTPLSSGLEPLSVTVLGLVLTTSH